jgi:hypothetical protein
LSEGRIIQSIDRIHDKVEIKLFNSFLSIGKTLISYEVQSYDYCNKLLLSVLAIPRLRFESELFKNFEAPFQPGQRSPIMDILIMNEIPESEIKRFDWILIKKLVFNGVDCGEYLIKNRRRDVNHLDSCLINELISSTTFGQHWNPEL